MAPLCPRRHAGSARALPRLLARLLTITLAAFSAEAASDAPSSSAMAGARQPLTHGTNRDMATCPPYFGDELERVHTDQEPWRCPPAACLDGLCGHELTPTFPCTVWNKRKCACEETVADSANGSEGCWKTLSDAARMTYALATAPCAPMLAGTHPLSWVAHGRQRWTDITPSNCVERLVQEPETELQGPPPPPLKTRLVMRALPTAPA